MLYYRCGTKKNILQITIAIMTYEMASISLPGTATSKNIETKSSSRHNNGTTKYFSVK
ncbi:MAG: hypothetical protein UFA98_08505 [Ruminococcus sp.]|nr:hypothetical protein [Ruminococcus sp.]